MEGRNGSRVRLEEYASSGPTASDEDASDSVKVRPMHSIKGGVRHSASSSHHQNDRYMEAFDSAFEELSAAEAARTGVKRHNSRDSSLDTSSEGKMTSIAAKTTSLTASVELLTGSWIQGPRSPEGELHNVSAQPLMCMSMSTDESEVVVGSSDHALYVLPLGNCASSRGATSRPRTLYTKKFGHTEWVTCVTHLSDRRIVSGGMDSKLCLWDASGVKCEDLLGHSGSVSCVLALNDEMVLSAGYDKMLRLWNVSRRASSRQRDISAVKASTAPILDVSALAAGQQAVCGDRDGGVQLIDLQESKVLRKHVNAHRGHTTSVLGSQCEENEFFSGGQDGAVKVWDSRQKGATLSLEIHTNPRSGKAGAVGFLREPAGDPNVLITAGADGVINVLDKRQSYGVLHSFTEHLDFIYSLYVHSQLCFSGAGNGMLHVHDWKAGKLLYGLGANQAAVRAITTSANQLIAAGDDGGVMTYDMK
ncbi:F-box/WD repeat-containing protein 7 [Phytophthora citrophthora]|uniref:F-box/WD repeat-containing protein 7 n=1 Tax=Phytophthora citrophthora TaxID=4793 RepID=A0AAD9LCF1_9STRA|nr:F-box/WD repeat-containing protein 7 [Phytophthora citrophthora]